MTCSICGQHGPCYISKATGEPWCETCRHRWARCSTCGEQRPVRGGTLTAPLCATCARPEPGFWRSCPDCGEGGRIHHTRCARCTIQRKLRDLISDETGDLPPQLQPFYQALAGTDRPGTVEAWLHNSAAPAILRTLAGRAQPLSHNALDELPPSKTVEHLRSVLVATGTLAARDEQLARLERWIAAAIADRGNPDEQQLLHRYAVWQVTRRLRSRLNGAHATRSQVVAAQRIIKAAVALLDGLAARGLTLATANQGDLEAWLTTTQAGHRADAGNFVRWAKRNKLTRLDFAAVRWGGPSGVIDTETRWQQARRLIHDDTLKPEDRLPSTPWPGRRSPARPRHHRRCGNLALAVPRRSTRPLHQRLPHGRTAPPARRPRRPSPLRRPVPARHRPARRRPRPHARHPHRGRRRLATRLRRRLDQLRRPDQPPKPRRPTDLTTQRTSQRRKEPADG
jgi:hypothetical protein